MIGQNSEEKELIRFINRVMKLEAIEFAGLAKFFRVPIVNEDGTSRAFEEVLSDLIDAFILLNRKQKRNLFRMLKW